MKKQRFKRHANRVTDMDYAENESIDSNVDTESQDTSFSEETASGSTLVSLTVDYCTSSE